MQSHPTANFPELDRVDAQAIVFAERVKRSGLLGIVPSWPLRNATLNCHRNEVFEFVVDPLKAFASYSGLDLDVAIGAYDDTLSWSALCAADCELVWLNYDRYRARDDSFLEWLIGRLRDLRARSDGPIILNNWASEDEDASVFNCALEKAISEIDDAHLLDLADLRRKLGTKFYDARLIRIAGAAFSEQTYLELARKLGLVLVPSLLARPLKAVVFDADETLWSGVLSEDGVDGIRIAEAHRSLHQAVLELRKLGVFTALLSKNDRSDIEAAFAERADLDLKARDFDVIIANWRSKAEGVMRIAESLRIADDAILFVDDNPGELAAVGMQCRGISLLMAGPKADATVRGLRHYPGLFFRRSTPEDALRSADLAAETVRAATRAASSDPHEYLQTLKMEVDAISDADVDLVRAAEISGKTNQFNLAQARLAARALAKRVADREHRVVTLALRDRLSDSGVIGLLVARRDNHDLVVEDLCLSCRALGRGIEDFLVGAALVAATDEQVTNIVFPFKRGPRNRPVLDWLGGRAGAELLNDEGAVSIPWDWRRQVELLTATPIELRVKGTSV